MQARGFYQLLLQLVVTSRHQHRPAADVVDLASSEEEGSSEEEEWEEVLVDNLAAYEAAFPDEEDGE